MPTDFKSALRRQLGFLASSCQSFDAGFYDEAIRIAQCIRVLIHDTKNQRSLLTHLNAKHVLLTSSCLDIRSKIRPGMRALVFNGMGQFATGSSGARYYPKLGDGMFRHELSTEEWLAETGSFLIRTLGFHEKMWHSRRRTKTAARTSMRNLRRHTSAW